MTLLLVDESHRACWDDFNAKHPKGNFRQSFGWGEVKGRSGWEPVRLMVQKNGEVKAILLILKKRLPLGFSLFYGCRGPVVDWSDEETVHELVVGIREQASRHKAIVFRMDPEPVDGLSFKDFLPTFGFETLDVPYTHWNRTRYEIRLPLVADQTDEDLFMTFRRKHRQNIKTAAKKGVTVDVDYSGSDVEQFYELMQQLESNKYAIAHGFDYYATVVDQLITKSDGALLKAMYEDKIISAMLLSFVGNRCWAVYVANDYDYRNLMPNKIIMWEAIKLAKSRGCIFFDMGATQGTSFEKNSKLDSYKMAFRPDVIEFQEYFDLANSSLIYRIFNKLEFKAVPLFYRLKHWVGRGRR